ncbi:hypothetical protein [Microvirga sp. VF16]|uniref:hypothetical protein n=1 Tax=Microvirga sp. VF16 TaxID=2807101 RepID=UPI00193D6094|nr:hypothetical protein [Microvirga sp. VF16]QRM33085.1 hypothetical protein JO965_27635 [Microvirga sp. VF16]
MSIALSQIFMTALQGDLQWHDAWRQCARKRLAASAHDRQLLALSGTVHVGQD